MGLHGCGEGKVVGTHCGHAKDFKVLQGRGGHCKDVRQAGLGVSCLD